ncbi:hypothetical protein POP12_147 [Pectobacterium phage POP12]|nr:hypothetical protein POP12_147 [Pectobacterium phage POP12]
MSYYNPDGKPETDDAPRQVKIRFKTKKDLDEFVKKTGISITTHVKSITYPPKRGLDDFM